jgi:nitrous oxidase accessory protein
MKKISAMIFFSLFILAAFIGFLLVTIGEASTENTLYVGGSGVGNYSAIQGAINHANSNDIIYVYARTYHETVYINKTITLIGEDKNTTIIDGSGGYDSVIMISLVNNVTITNFTIQNGGYGVMQFGVRTNNITISGNIIKNNKGDGIDFSNSYGNTIEGNIIANNGSIGVHFWGNLSTNNIIIHNIIKNNSDGIRLEVASHNTVSENTITTNEENGIYVLSWESWGSSNNNTVSDNTIMNNTVGINVSALSMNNRIFDNIFSHNNEDIHYGTPTTLKRTPGFETIIIIFAIILIVLCTQRNH